MKYHYDLARAEPIIRDYVVTGTSDILKGAVVGREGAITTDDNRFGLQNADANVLDCLIGVTNELYDADQHLVGVNQPGGPLYSGTNAQTEPSTGVSNYIKVIINPMAVWLAEYSQEAANDDVNTSADSSGKVLTATFTTDREGDWCYVTDTGSSIGGAGNLFQIGLSNTTTSVTAVTDYDDYLAGTNTSDTFITMQAPFTAIAAGGSIDLSEATADNGAAIKGIGATGAGAAVTLANFIKDKSTPMEPLKVERNSGKTYDAASAHLYADLYFMEHILLGSSAGAFPTIA